MGTPVLSDIIDFGKTLAVQLGVYLKDIVKFLFTNFKFDNPIHLFTLSILLFAIVVSLIGLFGASTGVYGTIGIGSGRVLTGTGSGDVGSIFSDALEDDKWDVSDGDAGDSDGDGTPNIDDPDIDGDGLLNTQDYDVDGDGIPNDDDPSPCGVDIVDCNIPYPTLCGNGVCDSFLTDANFRTLPSILFSDCSDLVMCYDLPAFCLSSSPSPGTYVWHRWEGNPEVFTNAICGSSNLESVLNPRCVVDSDYSGDIPVYELWYIETVINCPIDCNESRTCYLDWTCDLVDNCATRWLSCCPPGTLHYGRCTDFYPPHVCNDPSGDGVTGSEYSLTQLRNMPTHCECSSDQDCINDLGGATCCPPGTNHEGFCYDGLSCDVV